MHVVVLDDVSSVRRRRGDSEYAILLPVYRIADARKDYTLRWARMRQQLAYDSNGMLCIGNSSHLRHHTVRKTATA